MALVLVDQGEAIALKALLNQTAGQDLVLRLYENNITPAETDTEGTYTEATFSGYASASMIGSGWTISGSAPTKAAYAQQTYTSTASQSKAVYGYYVTQATSGKLLWAERYTNAPINILNIGDQVLVTPQITQD